jgi:hypothetical protein
MLAVRKHEVARVEGSSEMGPAQWIYGLKAANGRKALEKQPVQSITVLGIA